MVGVLLTISFRSTTGSNKSKSLPNPSPPALPIKRACKPASTNGSIAGGGYTANMAVLNAHGFGIGDGKDG